MPLSSAFANGEFSGLDTKVSLSLKEDGGWKEDSKNSLQVSRYNTSIHSPLPPFWTD